MPMFSTTRRAFMQGALGGSPLLSQAGGSGQTRGAVASRFPGVAYQNYPRCLPDYLRALALAARQKR